MKCKEVLKILKVTRPTLTSYVKSGQLKVTVLPNGDYDYDEDSVLQKAGIDSVSRSCIIYARVSTPKQKKDLENQINVLTDFANSNGFKVSKVYSDIASGLNYDRENFQKVLKLVLERKIKTVIIKDKDRLTRVSFDMWRDLFREYNCSLVVMNDTQVNSSEEKEIFEDIISLLHCFAMRMYSARRKRKIELIKEDIQNELED